MTPCHVVEIETPKGVLLHGLWFGPKKPKAVIVWVHGFTSSAFARLALVEMLAKRGVAVLTFNNRGNGVVSRIRRRHKPELRLGGAKEVFTDCIDDIDGALNFAKRRGAKRLYLAGHSTGCQKSVYWAAKRRGGKGVRGIMLFAPVSDYAAEVKLSGKARIERAAKAARDLVKKGKPHAFLPEGVWHELLEAQRFLSLYEPESVEDVFPYERPAKQPRALRAVKVPIIGLWPEEDEYADHSPEEITRWFKERAGVPIVVIPKASHSFKGAERRVVRIVRSFMESMR